MSLLLVMVHIVGEGKPLHWGLNLSWIRGPRIIVRAFGLQLYWRWRWEHGMRPFEWWFGRILCTQRRDDLHTPGAAWARTLLQATGGCSFWPRSLFSTHRRHAAAQ